MDDNRRCRSALLDSFLDGFLFGCNLLFFDFTYITNLDEDLDKLKNATGDLVAKRDDVLRRVHDEEFKGGRRLASVVRWLSKVQTTETNTNMFVAEASNVQERLSTYGYCSINIFSVVSFGKNIPKMLREVRNLNYEGLSVLDKLVHAAPIDHLAPNHEMVEYLHNLENNLEALEMGVQALNAIRNELVKRVSNEKRRGLQMLPEVVRWIARVEETETMASSLLDKSIYERHKLSKYEDCFQISASTHRYNGNVRMRLEEVKTLKLEGVFEVVVDISLLPLVKKRRQIQPTVSQEKLFENTWNHLTDKNVGSLRVYGMSGVGKTTMLTQIKHKGAGSKYGLVIFVLVVTQELESIQDEIAQSIGIFGNSNWRQQTQKEKAFEISKFLNGMRYLLLLDDVQKELDLEEIGVPLPSRENGSKVIFTTSSRVTCGSKWVDDEVEIKCLSPDEAWDLFQEIVGEPTLKSHPEIPHLARIVARKCGGLPIALSLIGEIMSCKRSVREWHHAIHALFSSTAEFSDMGDDDDTFLPILKFTYDSLPRENIKLCFLYCALFPKNSDVRKGNLVDYWIGEGIIKEEEDREIAKIQGYEMINDLVRMKLLMEDESGDGITMHGMVREMALWIASDFGRKKEQFVVVGPERILEMPKVNDWRMVRRMSVTSTQIEEISKSPPYCSTLTTLFLQDNNKLSWISGAFFRRMTSLVVLNLSNTGLSELPEEVSCLESLQFLNLSRTLMTCLPYGLRELKRLIHLDLEHTFNLQGIEVISSLLNLQVLRLLESVPVELGGMKDIEQLQSLKELTLTVTQDAVLERLLGNHLLASCTRRLSIRDIRKVTVDWRSNMIRRVTVRFSNIEEIPQFWHLSIVSLDACDSLTDLTWLLSAPCLRELSLTQCSDIKQIISQERAMAQLGHTREQPFQKLTTFSLIDLPELESIYWTPLLFPVLQYLEIRGCPKLTRLPFNSESAKGTIARVEFDFFVFTRVKWEDEATKQRFCNLN